ncbi:hypothetical protein Tco_1081436 [Tanacetum coccineum]|uniref:Uncharacterized protein n=1 Tax=Tanacetum coccineum TaxID=301880 RepID=A0ABQ5HYR5_9ASTR
MFHCSGCLDFPYSQHYLVHVGTASENHSASWLIVALVAAWQHHVIEQVMMKWRQEQVQEDRQHSRIVPAFGESSWHALHMILDV